MPSKREKKRNKLVICITGAAGSGKTTLSDYLNKKGFCVISVDELGHRALYFKKDVIKKTFGEDVIDKKSGKIYREKLRKKLKTEEDWHKLEAITHPVIYILLKEEIEKSKETVCVVDAAIPFTIGIDSLCNVIIKIQASNNILKERLMKRGIESSFIDKILKKQKAEFKRDFDYIIENNRELETFLKTSEDIINRILSSYLFKIS